MTHYTDNYFSNSIDPAPDDLDTLIVFLRANEILLLQIIYEYTTGEQSISIKVTVLEEEN